MTKLISRKELIVRLEYINSLMNPKAEAIRFDTINDVLHNIEIGVVYTMFDLEATRRERDARKKL